AIILQWIIEQQNVSGRVTAYPSFGRAPSSGNSHFPNTRLRNHWKAGDNGRDLLFFGEAVGSADVRDSTHDLFSWAVVSYFLCSGDQFRRMVIGEDSPATMLIRKRCPSGEDS